MKLQYEDLPRQISIKVPKGRRCIVNNGIIQEFLTDDLPNKLVATLEGVEAKQGILRETIFVKYLVEPIFSFRIVGYNDIYGNECYDVENINTTEEPIAEEEFVDVLEDGTRINSSSSLHETKIFDGLEISDFQLTEKDNMAVLLGTITNNSSTAKGGYAVDITVVDKDRNEMTTVVAYIKELQPGENTILNVSSTFDYANAYDFTISRK